MPGAKTANSLANSRRNSFNNVTERLDPTQGSPCLQLKPIQISVNRVSIEMNKTLKVVSTKSNRSAINGDFKEKIRSVKR